MPSHSTVHQRQIIRSIRLVLTSIVCLWFTPMSPSHAVQTVDYASLYAKLSPTVVTIRTATNADLARGNINGSGVGSGFLIEEDLIMTAAHVVDNADLIMVRFKNGKVIPAEVIASVQSADAALLRLTKAVPDAKLTPLGTGDSVAIGEPVFIIGAPFGIEHTLSVGHLSGKSSRSRMAGGAPVLLLQTDTAINPGNSGGPMFNQRGEAIGVVSFILSKSGASNGIGFATAIETAHDALMNSSGFWAGFEGVLLTEAQAQALNLPEVGILVQRVVANSAAGRSGLKAGTFAASLGDQELLLGGDVIIEINGLVCADPHDFRELSDAARQLRDDQSYELSILRNGEKISLLAAGADEFRALGD